MKLVVLTVVALAFATAAEAVPTGRPLDRQALSRAAAIGVEVTARYRSAAGRKLAVTEVTTTGVVASFTLIDNWLDAPRVVPAENGIYFAICSRQRVCPYRARGIAWQPAAFLPRRQALELALRVFSETSANLVVVSLPTSRLVWIVFERDDVLSGIESASVQSRLSGRPRFAVPSVRRLVLELTRPRLYLPLPILPPPPGTIYAERLIPK
ncbi:MAG: hypothetical protein ABR583_13725 [Gaiellaceae bacterium]